MTMKPKAKKFRIRRSPAAAALSGEGAETERSDPAAAPPPTPPAGRPQFSNAGTASKARSGEVASPRQVAGETDIDSIRAEGLTGRQLRMARRVANKHGLEATSDFDAVRLLRERGIDPFQRTNMLELVQAEPGEKPASPPQSKPEPKVQLPQTVKLEKAQLPSTETVSPAERRAAEILKIQRELAARRRKKMMLLMVRLAAFVLLPTLIAGYYFYAVATPMYSTKSEFLILKAESSGGAMGSLFSGTQFATNQDAIAVQSYLTSKDAMLRLDRDEGFKSHFTQEFIDPIQRLDPEPTNEEAYSLYKRHVQIGYDPTEGVIKMEVMAADPQIAANFSSALIGYAEERVDNLSLRKRSNAVKDAEEGLIDAESARREAQEKLVRMQQEGNVVDPEGRIAALRSQINTYELQLQEKQLQLQALLDNSRPNQAKVEGAQGDIRRLEALLDRLNREMTTATTGKDSLAEVAVQIKLAEADLSTRDLMLQTALERLEQARRDADSQARYLTTSVVPVPSEDPSYPRKFENTMLAFLIFGGIYLMISLTASILREQVAS
ncbi:capsule biosynthesis protein [Mameliella alba]|uniref:Capsular polysaccharide export inner-membrane protein, BexC/CtrB/KpsE family n=1 Tax=Mameliella alba TaxID=561184 RepID=A0A0B3RXI1_9RHOB|nr:capsule biosynthesis protein [Mameliella alba]KHQ52807.1 Capsular polysaccharide export inner-membrane protein, BexC/CtrB/KpsE family [Mameliella alba]MBY6117841.1 capsule biosynthesis protein [Mameliella alba]OWV44408.1 capsule biosynthesis protein [Mameliella alba]OWV63744.1 capsule biosynthesis protein [Mameliella alba]